MIRGGGAGERAIPLELAMVFFEPKHCYQEEWKEQNENVSDNHDLRMDKYGKSEINFKPKNLGARRRLGGGDLAAASEVALGFCLVALYFCECEAHVFTKPYRCKKESDGSNPLKITTH